MGEKEFSEVKIITLLYVLCRDYLVPGKMEDVFAEIDAVSRMPVFSNEHLSDYAQELAERLKEEEESEPKKD